MFNLKNYRVLQFYPNGKKIILLDKMTKKEAIKEARLWSYADSLNRTYEVVKIIKTYKP